MLSSSLEGYKFIPRIINQPTLRPILAAPRNHGNHMEITKGTLLGCPPGFVIVTLYSLVSKLSFCFTYLQDVSDLLKKRGEKIH